MVYIEDDQGCGGQFANVGEGNLRGLSTKTAPLGTRVMSTIKPRWSCSHQILPLLKSLHSIYSLRQGVWFAAAHASLYIIHWVPSCLEVTGTQYAIYLLTAFHLEKLGSRRTFTTLLRSLHNFAAFVDSSESHIHEAGNGTFIEGPFFTMVLILMRLVWRFKLLLLVFLGLYMDTWHEVSFEYSFSVFLASYWCVPFRWNWRDPSRQMDFSISVVYISRQHCSWM